MAIVFALISALGYGTGDFCAGLAGRRWSSAAVSGAVLGVECLCAALGVILFGGSGPSAHALGWGALGGLGGLCGTLALYRGLARGSMTVVATLSAVLTAVLPVLVGLALGDSLSAVAAAGIVIAIPAVGLVSWTPNGSAGTAGARYGLLAGLGFALQFIALDRAGTHAGAWPVLAAQAVGLIVCGPLATRTLAAGGHGSRQLALVGAAGVLTGGAALFYLAATGRGELSIVAVIASLYPAFTIVLARILLSERWSRNQLAGLLVAAAAIVLVSVG
jgi:uncharacterized membrane protein